MFRPAYHVRRTVLLALGVCVFGVLLALSVRVTGIVSAATPPSKAPSSGGMGMPTSGYVTTLFVEPISYEQSGYYYDQYNTMQFASYVFHHGIDVSGGCVGGVNPVYAAASGTVAVAQYVSDGYGTQVIIDNGYNVGGNGKYTYTFYSHMGSRTTGAKFVVVSPGQYVQAGQLIGYQGNDGSTFGSCGPDPGTHLDWEIRVSSSALTYGTSMRYNATAASPDYYTYMQVSYTDAYPTGYVSAGPFNTGPAPTTPPQPTSTPNYVPPTDTPWASWPTDTPEVLPTRTPGPCGMSFSDLEDSYWAYGYISDLYCRHVISGFSDGTFRPTNSTTRGQFTKMLVLSMGWSVFNPVWPSFNDVPTDSPYYAYIETAHLRGVIGGYDDGTFRPNNPLTRGQTAKMLVLGKGWQPAAPGPAHFLDVPPDYWAYGYIETAHNMGIIDGYIDATFHPEIEVNRAQLSKMLSLAVGR